MEEIKQQVFEYIEESNSCDSMQLMMKFHLFDNTIYTIINQLVNENKVRVFKDMVVFGGVAA